MLKPKISSFFRFLFCLISIHGSGYAQKPIHDYRHIVDTTLAAHPKATGILLSVVSKDGKARTYAAGVSDKKTGAKLKPDQPVSIASNTKTYISAAILKLCEQKKLQIEDSIGNYLSPATLQKLRNKGYKTEHIIIAHLLSHTSAIDDYVNDAYFDFVNTHKQYKWTRDEQIDRAMQVATPLGQPGDTFKYADINYLLLTEIIENRTNQPFYKAVRELLKYGKLKLNTTWFTMLEPRPAQAQLPAHQYWDKYPWDAYDIDPSWDLYGGGGIFSTTEDMARFFKFLFEGKIIKDLDLVARLYTALPFKSQTNYVLGVRKVNIAGLTGYYHGGFWGTDAIYFPEIQTAISIAILEKSERDLSAAICIAVVESIKKNEKQ